MTTATTDSVQVSVLASYQPNYSNASQQHFLFAYQIFIKNNSDYTLQLKTREWHIFDSIGAHRKVEGEGVVGEQPVLGPGEEFSYTSSCNLCTDIGSMQGYFYMERIVDAQIIKVEIPKFALECNFKMN